MILNTIIAPQPWEPNISLLEEFLDLLPLQYRTIVALAYFTASRIEDILSLQKQDITPETIIIQDSTSQKRKKVQIIARLQPYLTVYLNGYESQPSNLLFTDQFGQPLKSSQVFKVLKIVAKKINLPDLYLFVLR
ncbi:MAG: tyrosine-type recombinase/integrase [Crocosphaera sp.]|nr:tyrosine-type recombinase/integrase [Crocosphaera sp.]